MIMTAQEKAIMSICKNGTPDNPCFGCTSGSCKWCPMEYENGLFLNPYELRPLNKKTSLPPCPEKERKTDPPLLYHRYLFRNTAKQPSMSQMNLKNL